MLRLARGVSVEVMGQGLKSRYRYVPKVSFYQHRQSRALLALLSQSCIVSEISRILV